MTSTVELLRDDGDPSNDAAGWSPTTGKAAAAPDIVVWSGPARLQGQPSNRVSSPDAGGQAMGHRIYLVEVPTSAPDVVAGSDGGDRLRVLTCPGDPGTVGRVLHVVDVEYSSQSFTRALTCLDILADNNP